MNCPEPQIFMKFYQTLLNVPNLSCLNTFLVHKQSLWLWGGGTDSQKRNSSLFLLVFFSYEFLQNSKDFNSVLSNQVERKFQLIPPIIENPNRTSHPFLSTGCSKCTQKSSQVCKGLPRVILYLFIMQKLAI